MPVSKQVQMRRGTTAENNVFTGAAGEVVVDTTLGTLRVHDSVTVGGSELALGDLSNVPADTAFESGIQTVVDDKIADAIEPLALSDLSNVPEDTDFENRIMEEVASLLSGGTPVPLGGTKKSFTDPGVDYLKTDGRLVSKTSYPALYAAISDRFRLDGLNATSNTRTVTDPFGVANHVAASGTLVSIVFANNMIATSNDSGKTWVTWVDTANLGGSYNRVFILGSTIVAIGGKSTATTNAKTAYSTDNGVSWTVSVQSGNAPWVTAWVMNNIIFTFTGSTSGVYSYSSDGISWNSGTTGISGIPVFATYNSRLGLYLLTHSGANILASSPNGTTWTTRVTAANPLYSIADNGTILVAAGGNNSTTTTIQTSPDGITWTTRTATAVAASANTVVWFPAGSIFLCGGNLGIFGRSTDGITWTQISSATAATSGLTVRHMFVTSIGVSAITIGGSSLLRASNQTWEAASIDHGTRRSHSIAGINASNGDIWACGASGTASYGSSISVSKDAGASFYSTANFAPAVINVNRSFIVTDGSSSSFNSCYVTSVNAPAARMSYVMNSNSKEGTADRLVFSGVGFPNGLKFINGRFVLYGYYGGLSYSIDGINWTTSYGLPSTVDIRNINWNGNQYILVTQTGDIYRSNNLETWTLSVNIPGLATAAVSSTQPPFASAISTSVGPGVTGNISVMVFIDWFANKWIITTSNISQNTYATSSDGIDWTTGTLPWPSSNRTYATAQSSSLYVISNRIGETFVTSDLLSWTISVIPASTGTSVSTGVSSMAYGNGVFVIGSGDFNASPVATNFASVSYSIDGIAWVKSVLPFAGAVRTVNFSDGFFTVVGSQGTIATTSFMASSFNGQTWNSMTASAPRTDFIANSPIFGWTTVGGIGVATTATSMTTLAVTPPAISQFRIPNIPDSITEGQTYIKAV